MADFCTQCSIELFGEDIGDLAHLGGDRKPLEEGYGYGVICEGCGPTVVNDTGACVAVYCKKHGDEGKEQA